MFSPRCVLGLGVAASVSLNFAVNDCLAHTVGSEVVLFAEKRAGVDRSVQIVPVEVGSQLIDLNPQRDALR